MTVQQLFKKVGFESIMEALQVTHRNDNSIRSTASYKQAFDKLVRLNAHSNCGKVTFDITPREHWFDKWSLPLLANGVEGDHWEDIIGKEVIKPDDNPFTDAELAGAILWGATFYGFTKHSQWTPFFFTTYTNYGEQAKTLERKLYTPYIRDNKTLRDLKAKDLRFGIAFSCEVWREIRHHQLHQNRQKRKRFYRLKKRISYLNQLDKRAFAISEIESKTRKSLGYLADTIFNAGSIHEVWRESHVDEPSNRIKYLIDLCSNYFPQATDILDSAEKVVITAYTSPDSPLTQDETATLQEYFKSLKHPTKIHFFEGTDPNVASALDVQFVCISDTVMECSN